MHAFVNKLKKLRIGAVAIRRNPMYYASARDELRALEHADVAVRREWTQARTLETLSFAGRSTYGRCLGRPAQLDRWPLLEKSSVRNDPGAFLTGPPIFAAPASTGGTTGVPLQLTRSLRSIVVGQACIDQMVQRLRADARRARVAVLRGENEYRFLPGYAHVELHPTAKDGEHVLYEIIGTNLWNFAMPLPRYRTGDLVRLPASWSERELEEVTLGVRPFPGVLGRDSDIRRADQLERTAAGKTPFVRHRPPVRELFGRVRRGVAA